MQHWRGRDMASLGSIKRRLDRLDGDKPGGDRHLFFVSRELAAEAGQNGPRVFRHPHVLIEALPDSYRHGHDRVMGVSNLCGDDWQDVGNAGVFWNAVMARIKEGGGQRAIDSVNARRAAHESA